MSSRRLAAIDIGTNTVLLTIAEVRGAALVPVLERATITRLGAGVDRSRRLAPAACEQTLACLTAYASEIRAHACASLDVVGTSALRDAGGGEDFLAAATERLGVRPRVVSGEEEARLTFVGGLADVPLQGGVVVMDVGGGSTELITGHVSATGATVETALSLDVGSVRLFERHLTSDPPRAAELERARDDVRALLSACSVPTSPRALVGVAGTVTTLAAVSAAMETYDGARLHGTVLTRQEVGRVLTELAGLSLRRRAGVPGLEPGRADVIVSGGIVVAEVMDWLGATSLRVSDRGVRWGLLAALRARAATS